ncbi:MAG TPA: S9 family peptidase [Steroidobacteraceae bacterium]|nr:S9 family peptidase [Steroidobacteraceae bacterium]
MRATLHQIACFAALSACASSVVAAAQPLSAEQALAFIRISDLHFSPDGAQLAYVASSYRWDALPRVRIVDTATGSTHELTPAGKSARSPQWSPDGSTLAFLSNLGGKMQVHVIAASGGEPAELTAQRFGVERFHWSPDGRSIAYLAKDDSATDEGSDPRVADQDGNLARLWVVDVKSKVRRNLGRTGYRIDDFQWADATRLLLAATDKPRVEEFTDAVYSLSTADGTFNLVAQPPQPFDSLLTSPDGREFAVRSTGANGPIARDLFIGPLHGGALRNTSAVTGLAVADVRWHQQATVWTLLIDGFYNRIFRLPHGGAPVRVELPLSVAAFDVSRDGVLAYAGEDFEHLPEIYVRDRDGAIRQLGQVQQGWEGIALATTRIFHTAGTDGTPVEAALMQPAEPVAGTRPLVLLVHGGPAANFSAGYGWQAAWAQLLAAHGYQVLMVNPRGSNGYGEAFVKANRADWGGGDYRDLITVLDAVIASGGTDSARLGIGGWSYGGEMAAWAITQTDRFKAAVVGAGVFDQQAEFETEDRPAGDQWYFGTPWEHPEVFARNSPATYIRNARTPTLILGGEDDTSNPVGQSKGLYRALKHFGVETEMVLYPGEGHSPRRGEYNIDMFERILSWYDRHLAAQ